MRASRFKRFGVWNRVLVCLTLVVSCVALLTRSAQAKMGVGTNLNSVNYFTTERPFIDAMKHSSGWITSEVGVNQWDSGQAAYIPVDSNGWPTQIPFSANFASHYVHALIPGYANGTYTIKTVGSGTFKLSGGSNSTVFTPTGGNNTYTFAFNNANLGRGEPNYIYLDITQSASGDPLRNIQILLPGFGSSSETFYSVFKSRLGMYSTLRFMDWGNTNNSTITSWNQRTLPTTFTQGGNYGVAYEYMIQLCNETGKDMWVCVPQAATSDYVTQLATLIKNNLNTSRKVYIEYSNEVWNGQFNAGVWVNNNVAGTSTLNKYGVRCRQVFDLFTAAFGGNARLVRVIAGQAANSDTLDQAYVGAGGVCDAFAIAPYFGKAISPSDVSGGIPSLDTLIGDNNWNRTAEVTSWTNSAKTLANSKGKRLVCYEGGQHYTAYLGAENNQPLVDQLIALNRDYRIRDYYRNTYLPAVNNAGVDLFMHFSDVSSQGKFGSWGSMEYMDQTVSANNGDAVKYWAIQDWINNAPVGTPTPTPTPAPSGGPKYEAENAARSGGAAVNTDHSGYSGSGFVDKYDIAGATTTFTVSANTTGSYNVNLRYANATGAARTISIYVNGSKIRQTSLPSLANWDTWGDKVEALSLNSGSNSIAYKYDSGDNGNVNLDYVYCDAASGTGSTSTKYEAENASSRNVGVNTNHTGYSGTGFVEGFGNVNDYVTFAVNTSGGGNKTVTLRYANGSGAIRTMSVYVNGTRIRQTSMSALSGWDTWGDKVETLSLNSGSSNIMYRRDSGDNGGFNIDCITVQ